MSEKNDIDEKNSKGKRSGQGLFFIGLILLLIVAFGGWNLVVFILSQVFLVSGLIIWTIFLIRERKRHPVKEPKWMQHLKQ